MKAMHEKNRYFYFYYFFIIIIIIIINIIIFVFNTISINLTPQHITLQEEITAK